MMKIEGLSRRQTHDALTSIRASNVWLKAETSGGVVNLVRANALPYGVLSLRANAQSSYRL
jgi:hypothetical protein